jgi:hypothetical protein
MNLGLKAILNLLEEAISSSDELLFGTCSHPDLEYRDSSCSESEVDDIPRKKRKICDVQVTGVNDVISDCCIDIW